MRCVLALLNYVNQQRWIFREVDQTWIHWDRGRERVLSQAIFRDGDSIAVSELYYRGSRGYMKTGFVLYYTDERGVIEQADSVLDLYCALWSSNFPDKHDVLDWLDHIIWHYVTY